jgi:hypothetical protein
MAELNVFEMTNMALKNLDDNKTATKSTKKSTSIKESAKKSRRRPVKENRRKLAKISCGKIKLESMAFMEEAEDDDFDFTPDDEVVLVIDTDMEEVPATEEDAVEAAQALIGDTVCKCSVCGANYVCDHTNGIEEDVDGEATMVSEEDTCPICGEEAPQIVVGEIVADTDSDVETVDDEVDVDVSDDDVDVDVSEDDVDFDEEDFEEACGTKKSTKRSRKESRVRRPMRKEAARRNVRRSIRRTRTENTKRPLRRRNTRAVVENRLATLAARKGMARKRVAENRRTTGKTLNFNEAALNKLFTKFATENYSNVKSVRFTKGALNRGRLTFEGVVRTVRGKVRPIKLVAEGFNSRTTKSGKLTLRVRENGPFTESAIKSKGKVPFVIECAVRGNMITPTSLKYSYTTRNAGLKESKNSATYKVFGSVK